MAEAVSGRSELDGRISERLAGQQNFADGMDHTV